MRRKRLRQLALLAAALALAAAAHAPVLRGIAAWASVDEPPEPASLIVPLGDPAAAARLVERDQGARVAVWRGPPNRLVALGLEPRADQQQRVLLERLGVPGERIVLLPDPTDDVVLIGRAVRTWLDGAAPSRPARVLLVAPAPWSRLFRHDLRRGLQGAAEVTVVATAVPGLDQRRWWRSEVGLLTYLDVYCLWAMRLTRG